MRLSKLLKKTKTAIGNMNGTIKNLVYFNLFIVDYENIVNLVTCLMFVVKII